MLTSLKMYNHTFQERNPYSTDALFSLQVEDHTWDQIWRQSSGAVRIKTKRLIRDEIETWRGVGGFQYTIYEQTRESSGAD